MDKSCCRIVFCNCRQYNKGALPTARQAYAGDFICTPPSILVKKLSTSHPCSTSRFNSSNPQLQQLCRLSISLISFVQFLFCIIFFAAIVFINILIKSAKGRFIFNFQSLSILTPKTNPLCTLERYAFLKEIIQLQHILDVGRS